MKLSSYEKIQQKLRGFIRKYFINELIKGGLLFITIGCLYFLLTLFIENFFWLEPAYRTALFWLFVLVEFVLFVKFILIAFIQLIGIRKGITDHQAAELIGAYFPEVSDKLVNVLELSYNPVKSDLLLAGIEQKSSELQPIPFRNAINFKGNKKYLKYAAIPVVIMLGIYVTGQIQDFNSSLKRVVNYNTAYQPPAPFEFVFKNTNFEVVENEDFHLIVETVGEIVPNDVRLLVNDEVFYLSKVKEGVFDFYFEKLKESTSFHLNANGINSPEKTLEVIKTPSISNIHIGLDYPKYINKPNELIQNTGNLVIPEGTNTTWHIETQNTEGVEIEFEDEEKYSLTNDSDAFSFQKRIFKDQRYVISSSNEKVKNFSPLEFEIAVIKDQYPSLVVNAIQDSIALDHLIFYGQVGDDYGVSELRFVYYDSQESEQLEINKLSILNNSLSEFYLEFPGEFHLEEGIYYECYFEVWDNDAVNGKKSVRSEVYKLYNPTEAEFKDALIEKQKLNFEEMDATLKEVDAVDKGLEELQNELQRNAELDWNQFQKLEDYLERQVQYEEMFEKQTEALKDNLEKTDVEEVNEEVKKALLERIEETKKSLREERLMKELQELAEKLDKEKLTDELQKIAKKNRRDQKNLERILELTKRFYVEQKLEQFKNDLKKSAEVLDSLIQMNELEKEKTLQKEFNKEFSEFKEKLEELEKENEHLKSPMDVPIDENDLNKLEELLEDALKNLDVGDEQGAEKSQKKAKSQMQRMSQSMESSMMQMQSETLDENIDDLRTIVENLLTFSFLQESVLEEFSVMESGATDFAINLRKQNNLKEFFEHIDDSIYSLSLRIVTMKMDIQNEISEVDYNMQGALSNLGDNRFEQGVSHQQFVLTSSNNLANMLGNLLNSMMNASMKMGTGQGDGEEFALPDIIKRQEKLMEQMEQGEIGKSKEGEKENIEETNDAGKGKGGSENGLSDEELFEIYKQQNALKEAMKSLKFGSEEGNKSGSKTKEKVISEMDQLEDLLLNKSNLEEILKKMTALKYELLKLEKARTQQGNENIRESETNFNTFIPTNKPIEGAPDRLKNYNEILIRQSLPLRSIYKKLVQDYFKENE